ncbi:hypothetical protein ACOME3_008515 [Neoechinorhynchus agilis]
MSWPPQGSNRSVRDVMSLVRSKFEVEMVGGTREFSVRLDGPKDSLYEGGVWRIRVSIPDRYPFKSPSIGFMNRIYHPNIDEGSGSVCLDVINQTWTPLYDLLNIFQMFLPQLLMYPNPTDPLNSEAAQLMMKKKSEYEEKVKEYVQKYATLEIYLMTSEKGAALTEKTFLPITDGEELTSEAQTSTMNNGVGADISQNSAPAAQTINCEVAIDDDGSKSGTESEMSEFDPGDDISEGEEIFEFDEEDDADGLSEENEMDVTLTPDDDEDVGGTQETIREEITDGLMFQDPVESQTENVELDNVVGDQYRGSSGISSTSRSPAPQFE